MNSDYYSAGVIITAVAVWIPLLTLFMVKRNFKNSYRLHEPITYDFSDEGYVVTGETFNSKSNWAKVYKVQIIKGWLLLYQNRMVANIIKIEPAHEENIEELKQFLKTGNFNTKLKW